MPILPSPPLPRLFSPVSRPSHRDSPTRRPPPPSSPQRSSGSATPDPRNHLQTSPDLAKTRVAEGRRNRGKGKGIPAADLYRELGLDEDPEAHQDAAANGRASKAHARRRGQSLTGSRRATRLPGWAMGIIDGRATSAPGLIAPIR